MPASRAVRTSSFTSSSVFSGMRISPRMTFGATMSVFGRVNVFTRISFRARGPVSKERCAEGRDREWSGCWGDQSSSSSVVADTSSSASLIRRNRPA